MEFQWFTMILKLKSQIMIILSMIAPLQRPYLTFVKEGKVLMQDHKIISFLLSLC